MQGLFVLGITGTKQQLLGFVEKAKENTLLKQWGIGQTEHSFEFGTDGISGGGVKRFLEKYKMTFWNESSFNINGIEEVAKKIAELSPELETTILTQYIDSRSKSWYVYNRPANETDEASENGNIDSRGKTVSSKNNKLPPREYFARMFSEVWRLNFGKYRLTPKKVDNRFEGKSFTIAGYPDEYGVDNTESLIKSFGGVVRGSVSEKSDYLLIGDDPGKAKIKKAEELGVNIIDVDAFEMMISK